MVFQKVEQPPSFKDHAYREIKRAIIQHDIAPGSTIHERTLSESLGISRTPLKLALQQLEMEGWVQSLPRKGISVKEIERKDVNEVFQLRKANEALVIELLIPLLNQEMLHKLEEKDQQLFELKEDPVAFMYHDSAFHLFLAELTNNERLYQIIRNLIDYVNWYGLYILNKRVSIETVYNEHQLIIEGLRSGDIDRTKTAMVRHLDHFYSEMMANLSSY